MTVEFNNLESAVRVLLMLLIAEPVALPFTYQMRFEGLMTTLKRVAEGRLGPAHEVFKKVDAWSGRAVTTNATRNRVIHSQWLGGTGIRYTKVGLERVEYTPDDLNAIADECARVAGLVYETISTLMTEPEYLDFAIRRGVVQDVRAGEPHASDDGRTDGN